MELRQIRSALRLRLGSAVVNDPGFAEAVLRSLNSYASYRDTFSSFSLRLQDDLFNALYDRLGAGMALPLDQGGFRRFKTSELPDAADDAIFVLFASLPRVPAQFERLHAYWMESGSPSAMRALYLYYPHFMPEAELSLMESIARENGIPLTDLPD